MENIVQSIKGNLGKLTNLNEENIKVFVVLDTLEQLGFDPSPSTFNFEFNTFKGKRTDIKIQVSKDDILYIETKSGYGKLKEKDIVQIAQYINSNSIEWGLLTNGKEYILLNNKIDTVSISESALLDKIVFRIDVLTNKEVNFLRFLSKESMFETKVTQYFKDIAQFRAYKFPNGKGSWNTYKGTLYSFFTYYADKEYKYRKLNDIRVDDFEQYLKEEQEIKKGKGKSVNAFDTFNNKYSHIRSMFNELKKQGKFEIHNFEEERKNLVMKLNYKNVSKEENLLTYENIKAAIELLEKTDSPVRNITLLMFCIYMGLERSTLRNLNWKMFNPKRTKITVDGRAISLPIKLSEYIKNLESENKNKGIKGSYLFYTYYGKKFNHMSESLINDVFNKLKKIDESDTKWEYFSPQYIRNCLITRLFENGFSIEEIAYLTGMDLVNISKLISFGEICDNVNLDKKRKDRKHPFSMLLDR